MGKTWEFFTTSDSEYAWTLFIETRYLFYFQIRFKRGWGHFDSPYPIIPQSKDLYLNRLYSFEKERKSFIPVLG